MVLVIAQLCLSLVLSRRYSFDLLIRSLFSSLPVPLPVNIRSLNHLLFPILPIPFSDNICVTVCSLISSLPDPSPDNSVLLFVLICLVLTNACPRLCLQPNPLVPPPCDSRFRPTPAFWTCFWFTLDITVCRHTILDCCLFPEAYPNTEYYFFIAEFCLAIGSCYQVLTLRPSFDRINRKSTLCGTKSLHYCQLSCEFPVLIQSIYISFQFLSST